MVFLPQNWGLRFGPRDTSVSEPMDVFLACMAFTDNECTKVKQLTNAYVREDLVGRLKAELRVGDGQAVMISYLAGALFERN